MKIIRFGDEIGYKAGLLIQKRAECNLKYKFQEAQRIVNANPNSMARAISSYTLYLCHYHGWGVKFKDEALALRYLKSSTELGYPVAGMELARHYLKEKDYFKAKNYIQICNKAFFKRDHCEQKKLKEEHNDMIRLLKVIESKDDNTENLSDEGSVGPEEKHHFNISGSAPRNRFNKSPRL